MIEANDSGSRERLIKEAQARGRRRKSAKWKSGLMLTGLGAVVLGAGYLAGVNAPAVADGNTAQSVAQVGLAGSSASDNSALAPRSRAGSNDNRRFLFNGDDSGESFENHGLESDDGTLLFNDGNGSGSSGQFNQQQPPVQQFGRRSRQFGGSKQQQPNFGGAVTRSRGS